MTMTLKEKYELVNRIASCADNYCLTDEEVIKSFEEEDLKALGIYSVNDIPNVYLKVEREFYKSKNFNLPEGNPRFSYHFRYGTAPNPVDLLTLGGKYTREEAISVLKDLDKQMFATAEQKLSLGPPTNKEILNLRENITCFIESTKKRINLFFFNKTN